MAEYSGFLCLVPSGNYMSDMYLPNLHPALGWVWLEKVWPEKAR